MLAFYIKRVIWLLNEEKNAIINLYETLNIVGKLCDKSFDEKNVNPIFNLKFNLPKTKK